MKRMVVLGSIALAVVVLGAMAAVVVLSTFGRDDKVNIHGTVEVGTYFDDRAGCNASELGKEISVRDGHGALIGLAQMESSEWVYDPPGGGKTCLMPFSAKVKHSDFYILQLNDKNYVRFSSDDRRVKEGVRVIGW